ncbi:MAG: methyl-accepting chemotaxis protein [Nitrospirae bacterium]|nr:methyl-accepting chemotaxis protein [Nitrospirota bacterium]
MGLTTRRNYRLFLYVNSLAIILLGAVITGWGVFLSFPADLGQGYHNVQALVREIGNVLFWRVTILYAVTSFLIVLAMVALHLVYSHRIAGPAYRISLEAARISQGDLTGNIKFRRKDNLTDMADLLNDLASQYRGRINAVRDSLAILDEQSKKVSDLIQQGKDGLALKQIAGDLSKSVKKIESSLAEMRI